MKSFKLYNGVDIPCIGYGTYRTPNTDEGYQVIKEAIEAGYRHIDTAQGYNNEHLIGRAIKESGLPRSDFFITTKIANVNQGYQQTLDSFNESLSKLESDYVDLLLIHWPIPVGHDDDWQLLNIETWKAMEELYNNKKVRAIGVSNFLIHHLNNLIENTNILPMVNQFEFHMKYQQREIVDYCQNKDILVESWGPLMRGASSGNQILELIGKNHKKDVGQVSIRYCLQKKILPLPKTTNKMRMITNQQVFDFDLDAGELSIMDSCNTTNCYVFHPDRNNEWQETINKMNEVIQ
ncbi:aldo/keto reductase [Anaerorhabdus sp.]|uniref:aldo/keto reductase n=1 Tax=Anaerorhabdus sp. TaxID=1872524 RepID=UPI002FCCA413